MNRHHYGIFVHNCRLVFLLRKEAGQVESLDKFQPAEWRWSIPQVCDAQWHHYALSVNYPEVNTLKSARRVYVYIGKCYVTVRLFSHLNSTFLNFLNTLPPQTGYCYL